ncbi:hypothetical protein [Legionella bononiensis]|nr:hypothetical protein [Legionella bononiensis]MBL7562800.1 hypothetical protein [Legionella bononiensis]
MIPWKLAMADKYSDQVITILTQCYDEVDPHSKDISHFPNCVQGRLNKIPNPLDYNVYIHSDKPGKGNNEKLKIFMINNSGTMIYCFATTGAKLTIDSCATSKGMPLTPTQGLSIDSIL